MLDGWLTAPQVQRILKCTRSYVSMLCKEVWALEKPPRAVKFQGKTKMQWLISPEAVKDFQQVRENDKKYKLKKS